MVSFGKYRYPTHPRDIALLLSLCSSHSHPRESALHYFPCGAWAGYLGGRVASISLIVTSTSRPPASGLQSRPPASGLRSPASGLRPPIPSSGLWPPFPASGLRPPIPASGLQASILASGLQPAASILQPLACSLQFPAWSLCPLASSLQHPACSIQPAASSLQSPTCSLFLLQSLTLESMYPFPVGDRRSLPFAIFVSRDDIALLLPVRWCQQFLETTLTSIRPVHLFCSTSRS